MKFSSFVFEYEKVVIGSSLEALLFAYANDTPLLSPSIKRPSFIEYISPDINLLPFGIENTSTILNTSGEPKEIGALQIDLWRHLFFFLSLAGNTLMSDKCLSLRFEEENVIKAITHNSRFARIRFEEAIVFDDNDIAGLPNKMIRQAEDKHKVIDWMDIKSGMNQHLEYFKTEDDFVNEIYLYPSDRIDGDSFHLKDAVSISYLTSEQLQDFDYSDTMVRFKTLKIFKEAGMKGASNGWCTKRPNKRRYYPLKIETTDRERYKIGKNIYEDTKTIKFNHQGLDELLSNIPREDSKPSVLCKQLFK